jgi:hypothetical protein
VDKLANVIVDEKLRENFVAGARAALG